MQCITLFLACNKGRYGLNCSQVCGHCKENTHCHHISGLCDWGCDTGYRGNQCTQLVSFCAYKEYELYYNETV